MQVLRELNVITLKLQYTHDYLERSFETQKIVVIILTIYMAKTEIGTLIYQTDGRNLVS